MFVDVALIVFITAVVLATIFVVTMSRACVSTVVLLVQVCCLNAGFKLDF